MPEENEVVDGATETPAGVEDSSYNTILEGEAEAPPKSDAGVKAEEETTLPPEKVEGEPQDQEIILDIGGKSFTMKQSEALALLENASKIAEREKTISEKEKSLNRDYTQKTQQVADFRKSIEKTFGYYPDQSEIAQMGKLVKAYHQSREVKQVVDQILSGRIVQSKVGNNSGESEGNSYASQLEDKILELEEKLGQFTSSIEERDNAKVEGEARQITLGWKAEKAKAGIKIEDEFIKTEMEPLYAAIRSKNPDWTPNQILDRAYKLATIDDLEKSAVSKVFKSAEEAKKGSIPRITPRQPAKSDSDKTYAEIIKESA